MKIFRKIRLSKKTFDFGVNRLGGGLKGGLKKIGKLLNFLRNPKLVLIASVSALSKFKRFCKRLPKITREYFFLMVMSPQSYTWRLERKNIKHVPKAYEIKAWQKHLRKKTFGFVFTGAMAVMLVISLPGLFTKYFAHSKTYNWVQTDWTAGAVATNDSYGYITGTEAAIVNGIANGANWSGWHKFWSKSGTNAIKTDTASALQLANITTSSAVESTSGTYTAGVYSGGTYTGVNSSTGSGVYSKNGTVTLKKPSGATCGGNEECNSGFCSTTCVPLCDATITANNFCVFGGLLYQIITGADNRLWMDRNLGATEVATAKSGNPCGNFAYCDPLSYGWLFQWGRAADGHQLLTWSANSETPSSPTNNLISNKTAGLINTTTYTVNTTNNYNLDFLTSDGSSGYTNYDWLPNANKNDSLWQCVSTNIASSGSCPSANMNNPCPAGFHVPTQYEWATLAGFFSPQTSAGAFSSALKLSLAGLRDLGGSLGSQGSDGYYWSSSPTSAYAYYLSFDSGGVYPAAPNYRSDGFSVRCIKN